MFVAGAPRYSREEAAEAIAPSLSYAEALRRLGLRSAGGNWKTLKRSVERWELETSHFDPAAARAKALRDYAQGARRPMSEILVEHSTYARKDLKRRLYSEGLKERRCELCGQDEAWQGRQMSLVLDHINGTATDNRLENLQIVCPNCAATLETHCGKNKNRTIPDRVCARCDTVFRPPSRTHKYCSWECSVEGRTGVPRTETRKVARPPLETLLAELEASTYVAVGRKYGVSDNAVRKWVRAYERERERLIREE